MQVLQVFGQIVSLELILLNLLNPLLFPFSHDQRDFLLKILELAHYFLENLSV